MRTMLAASAAVAALAAAAPVWAQAPAGGAQSLFEATTLSLSADGKTMIKPDQATITLGVQVVAPTAAAAMRDDAQRMTAVMAALKAQGLADKDVQTTNVSLAAQYSYPSGQPLQLTGYQASNAVTITVNDLAKLGPIIDAVTAGGANQVNGISFGLQDPTGAENAARLDAVKALQAKADLYAQATGYHVARLVNLTEGAAVQPIRPMVFGGLARADVVAQTPVSPGQLTVDVTVSATYELAR